MSRFRRVLLFGCQGVTFPEGVIFRKMSLQVAMCIKVWSCSFSDLCSCCMWWFAHATTPVVFVGRRVSRLRRVSLFGWVSLFRRVSLFQRVSRFRRVSLSPHLQPVALFIKVVSCGFFYLRRWCMWCFAHATHPRCVHWSVGAKFPEGVTFSESVTFLEGVTFCKMSHLKQVALFIKVVSELWFH